jgi:hypothetical protein
MNWRDKFRLFKINKVVVLVGPSLLLEQLRQITISNFEKSLNYLHNIELIVMLIISIVAVMVVMLIKHGILLVKITSHLKANTDINLVKLKKEVNVMQNMLIDMI